MTVTEPILLSVDKLGKISNDGIIVYSRPEDKITYFNPALLRILDLPKQSEINTPEALWDYIVADDREYVKFRLSRLEDFDTVSNLEFRIQTGSERKHLSCDAYVLNEEQKVLVLAKDVSRQKEREGYVINYGAKKNTLLEMVSHNLNGPLTLSQKVISMIENSLEKSDGVDIAAHVRFIKDSTAQCIEVISDLLKEEHLVSENIFVNRNRFDAVNLVKSIVDQYNHSHPGLNLTLENQKQQIFLDSDDVKYLQIMNNLISNSVKFSPEGAPIVIHLRGQDDALISIVEDKGIGIPEDLKPLIFQRNTPAGRSGMNGQKSLGIGLSITKRLVELLKGDIHFESKVNQGTTFYVTIPR